MQILIVEDDQRLARQLKKGLDENGHTVTLAFDGIDGLEAARQGRFDVVVLDVMLPRLDGFGVVKQLRKAGSKQMQLRIGNVVLDPAQHVVMRAGSPVALTRTEFVLLEMLMRNSGRVVTRDRLIEAVWGNEREMESNTLDVYVRQVRTKIEPAGSRRLIQTIRGVGYAMREEETA